MRQKFVKTNNVRLHLFEQGQGPLVLLCHGFPEIGGSWRHQLAALGKAGYHAVAPDMRGYGKSDCPVEINRYRLDELVADMADLVRGLGYERAVIAGNDWGATVAWQAALTRSDVFKGVIGLGVPLMGPPPLPPTEIFPQTATEIFYTLYFQEEGLAEAELGRDVRLSLLKILHAASGDAGPRDTSPPPPNPFGMLQKGQGILGALPAPKKLPAWLPEADFEFLARAFEATGFRGGLNYYRNLDHNWREQRERSEQRVLVPALYLVGERDTGLAIPGMREIIANMPALAPKLFKSALISGAGHWLQQEAPEQITREMLEFLSAINW